MVWVEREISGSAGPIQSLWHGQDRSALDVITGWSQKWNPCPFFREACCACAAMGRVKCSQVVCKKVNEKEMKYGVQIKIFIYLAGSRRFESSTSNLTFKKYRMLCHENKSAAFVNAESTEMPRKSVLPEVLVRCEPNRCMDLDL